jgi:hypothetical protein
MGGESSRASSPRARRESEANGKKCNSSLQILPRRTRALDEKRPCVINSIQVHILERGFFYTTLNYTKFLFLLDVSYKNKILYSRRVLVIEGALPS